MKPASCVALLAVALVLGAGIARAAPPGVPDPGQHGPYEVGFTHFMLTDSSRGDRPIPVYLWYPVDPVDIYGSTPEAVYPLDPVSNLVPPSSSSEWEAYGFDRAYQEPPPSSDAPFPVVVFSPGWGHPAWNHLYVGTRLASHGFAVAITYHWGDAWWGWEPADHLGIASMNRPLDISFILTELLARNGDSGDFIYEVIDPYKVAASGWSLGGYAAMALAGGDDLVCDKVPNPPPESCVPSPPDARFAAIVPLDGSTQLLYFDEMARITVPTMGIGEEWGTLYEQGGPGFVSWQARLHSASQGHPAYRVDLADAYHISFSNTCESFQLLYDKGIIDEATRDYLIPIVCAPPIPTALAYQLITKYMVAFLKTNLAGEPGYQPILTPGYALKDNYIEFFETEKRSPKSISDDWPEDFWYFMHQPGSAHAQAAKDPSEFPSIPHMRLRR